MKNVVQMKLDTGQEDSKDLLKMAPHTKVKHEILKGYLYGWFNIMATSARKRGRTVLYIDGFAGPGKYDEGDDGSPIIALDCLLNHQLKNDILNGDVTFIFIFVEKNKTKMKLLRERIAERFPVIPDFVKIHTMQGEFEKEMVDLLSQTEDRLPPTFAFIDPFGYTLPMSLLVKIMRNDQCEMLINFMTGFIHRFAGADPKNNPKFDALFAGNEWTEINQYAKKERREFIINLYKRKLKAEARVNFTQSFEMRNHHNQVTYDLVFATNNRKGMALMKDAMWKAAPGGAYAFSDTWHPGQRTLEEFTNTDVCEKYESRESARLIFERFRGQSVPLEAIKWFIYLETNFRFRKACLKKCQKDGQILSVFSPKIDKPRKGQFPDDSTITFRS